MAIANAVRKDKPSWQRTWPQRFFRQPAWPQKMPPSKPPCWCYSPHRLNGEPVKGLLCAVAAPFAKRPSRGACAKSLHMCASATNGRYRSAHGSQGCPCLGKGCNKEHAHWLPCPKVCCCKRQHLPCCQCLPGRQPARFYCVLRVACCVLRVVLRISCLVLCALPLLPSQSKATNVRG